MTEPGAPVSMILSAQGLDLDATLGGGQAFCWQRGADGRWTGWIGTRPCTVWRNGDALLVNGWGLEVPEVERYFGLDLPWRRILATFPRDGWLERAQAFAPGLRVLRQEPWETLGNFICSALKQIVQIEQINRELRQVFGRPGADGRLLYPTAATLARANEAQLRACRTGFRARHLLAAARQVARGEVSLEAIGRLPTAEARVALRRIRGVGEKVANCVLLFAYGRAEAFPIDVWVERVLQRLYFKPNRRPSPDRMREFARVHFGPHAGYAQQFLFHWIRNDPTALPPLKKASARRT
jgi:N-glycosylase/DNA lyase